MDRIVYNGTLAEGWPEGISPDKLLSAPYLYQRLHTFAHRPLQAEAHLAILARALHDMHGIEWTLPSGGWNGRSPNCSRPTGSPCEATA